MTRQRRASDSWSPAARALQVRAEHLGLTMKRRAGGAWTLGRPGQWSANLGTLQAVDLHLEGLEAQAAAWAAVLDLP